MIKTNLARLDAPHVTTACDKASPPAADVLFSLTDADACMHERTRQEDLDDAFAQGKYGVTLAS